ncbi:uncharacterized protein VP01_4925g1, partial [Puccinia sorghi]
CRHGIENGNPQYQTHNSTMVSHPGRSRTFALVRQSIVWSGMKKKSNKYVERCNSCQRVKSSTQQPLWKEKPTSRCTGVLL